MPSLDSRGYALDASAFYSGIPFLSGAGSLFYTTGEILEEIKHVKKSFSAVEALIDSRSLTITEPSKEAIEQVTLKSIRTGDRQKISSADISIIALALDKNLTLLTDDYSAGNVGMLLGLQVISSSGKGLKETRRWNNYCSGCSKRFDGNQSECPLCGNKLRRNYRIVRK